MPSWLSPLPRLADQTIEAVGDLRACANGAYPLAQGLPEGAFGIFGPDVPLGSPTYAAADARAISPTLAPPPDPIPGWRLTGTLWPGERYIARIPRTWNGRLVVAGTASQRSEFANDFIWSDPLIARGYAYVCGNKSQGDGCLTLTGDADLEIDGLVMPRFALPGGKAIAFWHHAPNNGFARWMDEFYAITDLAHDALENIHGSAPEVTYAVGLSNGAAQVRYALEQSDRYAGGLAWNGVLWSERHNLLVHLPQAIEAMNAGHPELLEELGFPPDIKSASGEGSLYAKNLAIYWVITAWLHATIFDPNATQNDIAKWRIERSPEIRERIAAFAHTGVLRAKLIDLASEYDHLLPPKMHFDPYRMMVEKAGKSDLYRSALIADAQHVDAWSEDPNYPQMRPGYPRVMEAFDELVSWVEG
jgi:hypothetical protein